MSLIPPALPTASGSALSTLVASGLCLALAMPAFADDDGVRLAAEFEAGQTLSYVYHNSLNQQQFAQDMLVSEFFVDYELEFEMTVVQASAVYVDLELSFTRIEVDSSWGAFDSDTPETEDATNLAAQAFRPVLDETFAVRLRTNMEILGITGPATEHIAPDLYGLYARMFDEGPLAESLQPIFRLKNPPEALPTEEWTRSLERHTQMGEIAIRLDLTFDAVGEDGVAKVRIDGEHTLRDMHNTPVSPEFKEQRIEGAARWNTAEHRLEEWDVLKDFLMTAGNDQFAFKFNVTEQERLTRRAE